MPRSLSAPPRSPLARRCATRKSAASPTSKPPSPPASTAPTSRRGGPRSWKSALRRSGASRFQYPAHPGLRRDERVLLLPPLLSRRVPGVAGSFLLGAQLQLHRLGDLGFEGLALCGLHGGLVPLCLALGDALRAQLLQLDLAGEAAFLEFRIDDGGLRLELGHEGLLGFRRVRLALRVAS